MTRIDAHAHVLPPAYVEALGGVPVLPAPLEGLEAMMERHEIDAAVISTGPPGAFLGDPARARELARIANEGIADVVRGAPDRFAGLALLPLPDVDGAVDEIADALDRLSLDGVMLLTHVGATYLGDAAWDPVLAELDRRGAYVFVHPTLPPYAPPLATTRCGCTSSRSRRCGRSPSSSTPARWSAIPGSASSSPTSAARRRSSRIASPRWPSASPAAAAAAPAGALEYLRRLYYDTGLSNNAPALAATREVTELGHIVFGTDWPYAALPDGADPAPDLDVLGPGGRRGGGGGEHREAGAAARRRARLNRAMPALVVLGARNLGGAILDRFLADGWKATAIVRSAETAEAVEARGARAIRADVTDPSQLRDALAAAGPVDCLVNAVSVARLDPDGAMGRRAAGRGHARALPRLGRAKSPSRGSCSSARARGCSWRRTARPRSCRSPTAHRARPRPAWARGRPAGTACARSRSPPPTSCASTESTWRS